MARVAKFVAAWTLKAAALERSTCDDPRFQDSSSSKAPPPSLPSPSRLPGPSDTPILPQGSGRKKRRQRRRPPQGGGSGAGLFEAIAEFIEGGWEGLEGDIGGGSSGGGRSQSRSRYYRQRQRSRRRRRRS